MYSEKIHTSKCLLVMLKFNFISKFNNTIETFLKRYPIVFVDDVSLLNWLPI